MPGATPHITSEAASHFIAESGLTAAAPPLYHMHTRVQAGHVATTPPLSHRARADTPVHRGG